MAQMWEVGSVEVLGRHLVKRLVKVLGVKLALTKVMVWDTPLVEGKGFLLARKLVLEMDHRLVMELE